MSLKRRMNPPLEKKSFLPPEKKCMGIRLGSLISSSRKHLLWKGFVVDWAVEIMRKKEKENVNGPPSANYDDIFSRQSQCEIPRNEMHKARINQSPSESVRKNSVSLRLFLILFGMTNGWHFWGILRAKRGWISHTIWMIVVLPCVPFRQRKRYW